MVILWRAGVMIGDLCCDDAPVKKNLHRFILMEDL
jgi:hypothetical protein